MKVSIPLVMNPTAGGGRLLRSRADLDMAARARGVELEWQLTEGPGHAVEVARQAAREGHPMLLAFGGDGTYNEVARGLIGSHTAMGALPGGTTSVLVYELQLPRSPTAALDALLDGRDRAMRAGRTSNGELFLLMLSAGPDAFVLRRLRPRLKRLGGRVGVAVQALTELLLGGELPRLRILADGQTIDGGWAIIGNSRCYGGPFHATPNADPFAPSLEVVLQRRAGRLAAVPFALGIATARHVLRSDVVQLAVDRLVIEPAEEDRRVPYQVDGDPVGDLPVEVWVDPQVLMVRVP